MKTHIPTLCPCLAIIALLLGATPAMAQPAAAAPPDKAMLKAQLDSREKRADLLLDELRALDGRIEDTVDRVIETLKMVGDTKDSRTKVARLKEQSIDGLQRNLTYYQQKRAALQEQLRRPTLHLTVEEKQRAIARFDERIEKRVQQIIALSKSLPTHKDYDRYTAVGSGWYGTTMVQNEDYKQNKRLTSHSNAQRAELIKGLQGSIDRIDRQNRTLRTQIAAVTNVAHRKMLTDEMAKNDALLKIRREQLHDVHISIETPTRPISSKEAQDMDMALRRTIDSLKRDFTTLFQRYSAYITERSNVNAAKSALEAVK
jgi:hypothetical protein